ncbi:hypothetical protein [Haloferax sp. DFSO52]|uniref:hypothetical protein n=1 Tax=Haloferax sp. DFSO52 TaxID=3388505 RepID=UPI003A85A9D7
MAEPVRCDICGETLDPRGLPGHLRFAHGEEVASTDGGSVPANRELTDAEVLDAVPEAMQEGNAITFRNEIRVTDAQAKRELVEALKERIRAQNTVEL